MKENISGAGSATNGEAFYIEAAISEGGPRKLRVVPSGDEYMLYDEDSHLGNIRNNDAEWKVTKGDLPEGVANSVGRAISRYSR